MLRVIREIRPRWVVGENVLGIVSWDGGLVFEQVHADLEDEGYEVQAFVLPACSVGARTYDTEHGLSPMLLQTPSAMEARSENLKKKEQRFGNSGTLAQEVQTGFIYKRGLLPTPIASGDICHPERVARLKASGAETMASRKMGASRPNGIMDYLMFHGLLPTPTANDGKNATLPDSQKERISLVAEVMKYKTDGQTSQLNPLFVQEMMGFPYLWTELPFQSGEPNQSKPTVTR